MARNTHQHGIILDTSLNLADLGVSAFRGTNVATGRLGAFLQAIEKGRVQPDSYLLIENLDRLSRASIMDAFSLFARILNHGMTIVTLTDQKEYTKENCNDIGNILMSIIYMARAHDESLQKSKRLSAAWANKRIKAANGQLLTKRIPAWLTVNKHTNKIEPIPDRCELLSRIFEMSIGGRGTQAIAKQLNTECIDTWGDGIHQSRKASGWRASYIRKLLHNRAVLGEFIPHKRISGKRLPEDVIHNYYPTVIPNDVYVEAQNATVGRRGKPGVEASHINLFTHLLKCADCGGSIIRINKGPRSIGPAMVCDNGRRGLSKCGYSHWLYEEIETAILFEVQELNLAELINSTDHGTNLKTLHAQLLQIETQITDTEQRTSAILDAIETSQTKIPILTTRLDELTNMKEKMIASKEQLQKEYEMEVNRLPRIAYAQEEISNLSARAFSTDVRYKIRTRLRELISRIDAYMRIKKLIIRYRIGLEDESKTIYRFRSGKSVTLP